MREITLCNRIGVISALGTSRSCSRSRRCSIACSRAPRCSTAVVSTPRTTRQRPACASKRACRSGARSAGARAVSLLTRSKSVSDIDQSLQFPSVHSSLLSVSDNATVLRHAGDSPHWCYTPFLLPPRASERWLVRVEYGSESEDAQLMVGVMEEVVNSGRCGGGCGGIEDVDFNTFLGSDKRTWGYKTTGQL